MGRCLKTLYKHSLKRHLRYSQVYTEKRSVYQLQLQGAQQCSKWKEGIHGNKSIVSILLMKWTSIAMLYRIFTNSYENLETDVIMLQHSPGNCCMGRDIMTKAIYFGCSTNWSSMNLLIVVLWEQVYTIVFLRATTSRCHCSICPSK
jgi:hypothetical protein